MTHENNNIGGRAELPGSDEQKISEMLGGLKRVGAPKDFDFHLKARIAKAKPSDYQRASLFPILKYAMPLALFMAVGAGVLLVNSYNSGLDDTLVSQPALPQAAESGTVGPTTASTEPQQQENVQPEPPRYVAVEKPDTVRRSRAVDAPRSTAERTVPEGGSRDFSPSGNYTDRAISVAPTPRTPAGLSLNQKRLNEAFEMIEAEAVFEGGSWVVKSVKANGIADGMGLRSGDKVRSIDGTPVGERTEFPPSFSVGTIQVQRGDETVELRTKKPE